MYKGYTSKKNNGAKLFRSLRSSRKCAFGAFALCVQTAQHALIACQIRASLLAFETLHARNRYPVDKVLAAKMRVSCLSRDFETATLKYVTIMKKET